MQAGLVNCLSALVRLETGKFSSKIGKGDMGPRTNIARIATPPGRAGRSAQGYFADTHESH